MVGGFSIGKTQGETAVMGVYISDSGMQTLPEIRPIVLYQYPEHTFPPEGKPQRAKISTATGYQYQWYVNDEIKGTTMTLELKASNYKPGIHSLTLIARKDSRALLITRHLTFLELSSHPGYTDEFMAPFLSEEPGEPGRRREN
jgi:hypothetical protein